MLNEENIIFQIASVSERTKERESIIYGMEIEIDEVSELDWHWMLLSQRHFTSV